MSIRRKLGMVYRVLLALAVALSALGLIVYTDESIDTARRAATMCIEVILPSLFPFMVVSSLVIGLGFAESAGRYAAPFMRRLFGVNGACTGAFIMGIIGGYPVGARSAIASYEQGLCSKTECERMLSFCNNSGPAFILGVVGGGVFGNSRAGMLIYLAHVLASVMVGMCFKYYKHDEAPTRARTVSAAKRERPVRVFINSVQGGLRSVGSISAFVIFFAVAINMLFTSGALGGAAKGIAALLSPFHVSAESVERLLVGGLEMTSGLTSLKGAAGTMSTRLSMAAFMLGWAGISVHCQVLYFIGDSGLKLMPYLTGKLMHAVFSAGLIAVLSRVFPISVSAAALSQVESISAMNPAGFLVGALINCVAVVLCMGILCAAKPRNE